MTFERGAIGFRTLFISDVISDVHLGASRPHPEAGVVPSDDDTEIAA